MSASVAVSISYHRRHSLQLTKPVSALSPVDPLIYMCDDLTIELFSDITMKGLRLLIGDCEACRGSVCSPLPPSFGVIHSIYGASTG